MRAVFQYDTDTFSKKFERLLKKVHHRRWLLLMVVVLSLMINATSFITHVPPKSLWIEAHASGNFPKDLILPGMHVPPTPIAMQKAPTKGFTFPIGKVKAATTEESANAIHVPVLMYHYVRNMSDPSDKLGQALSISPAMFAKQMAVIKEQGYTTITPHDLYNALYANKPLPPKPVLVTFDDGYADFAADAITVIRQYDVNVTAFIPSDRIGTPNYMTWEQLIAVAQDPRVTIASHTRHHVNLAQTPVGDLENEIMQSRSILESRLGLGIDYFAYPYGAFSPSVVEVVKKSGYKLAFSTLAGSHHRPGDQFIIKRINVTGDIALPAFTTMLGS